MTLSIRRAEAIRDSIIAIRPNLTGRIAVKGKGEEQPRSFGTTAADHRANRRLEVRLLP
jgi:outer membrane protein OmpA-like peptidoglycan-associated protein